MNFSPNLPSLLSGRGQQQQQVPVTTTSGSPQNANMQKSNNSTNNQQVPNLVGKVADDNKSQVPPTSVHQQIQAAQINNNMGGATQQIINVQQQVNVTRNLNLPQQPAFAAVQQQHVMSVSQGAQKVGNIYQHMQQIASFQTQYQQSAPTSQQQQLPVHSTALSGQQTIFQKLQTSIPVPPPSQQHLKQVANQLSPSASQQNMQYSPPKSAQQHPHPQMKTTAKLASPGSQLQSIQRSPTAAAPHHIIVQPVQAAPALNKSVPSNTTLVASVSLPQQPNDPAKINPSAAPIKLPPSVASTLLQITTLSNSVAPPQPIILNSQTTIQKSVASEKPATTKAVDQPKEPALTVPPQAKPVPKQIVEEKAATPAPKTMPVLQEANKKVEKSPVAQEASAAPVPSTTPAKAAPATPLASKSTMRLATVTPNRQKKPPATVPNNKKAAASPAVTSVAKTPAKALATAAKPVETVKTVTAEKSPKKPAVASPSAAPSTPIAQSPGTSSVKTKRSRVKVQHFQSPTPEIALVTKLSTQTANPSKNGNNDDKLTIFYKNEFLALRNGEEGFFLCQTMHNVYKSSSKIKIRWLDEQKKPASSEVDGRTYSLSYFDTTDFECVLTTVELNKVEGKIYELEEAEQTRIESILKKAIDVEKGVVPRPTVTEENPDGLDLSLYKDEAQLEKMSPTKRKRGGAKDKTEDDDEDYEEVPIKRRNVRSTPVAKSSRAAANKPVAHVDSSESDEENLMEIKNKAKKLAPEALAAKSKPAPKATQPKAIPPPKPSTSAAAGRGTKRGAKPSEETPTKVAKPAEKVEAAKLPIAKPSTSKLKTPVKGKKEPAKSPLKKEPVEEAKPSTAKKAEEKTNGSKIQQSPGKAETKKSPAKSKPQASPAALDQPSTSQARSTRSRK